MNVIIYKYCFDEMPFFYDVISSKFACGFFRLAILKFKLLTCNYNLRLGTTFDIDFSHRTGALGLTKSSRSGGAIGGWLGQLLFVNRIHLPAIIISD